MYGKRNNGGRGRGHGRGRGRGNGSAWPRNDGDGSSNFERGGRDGSCTGNGTGLQSADMPLMGSSSETASSANAVANGSGTSSCASAPNGLSNGSEAPIVGAVMNGHGVCQDGMQSHAVCARTEQRDRKSSTNSSEASSESTQNGHTNGTGQQAAPPAPAAVPPRLGHASLPFIRPNQMQIPPPLDGSSMVAALLPLLRQIPPPSFFQPQNGDSGNSEPSPESSVSASASASPPGAGPGYEEGAPVFHPQYGTIPQNFTSYDMSKQSVASARMPGVTPTPTGYMAARPGQPQYYVETAQEQMWPQQAQYYVSQQQGRPSRMPLNNGQMSNPMGGFMGAPGGLPGMAPYMGIPPTAQFQINQQGIQIVQQAGAQQYMYGPQRFPLQQQPTQMSPYAAMPQQFNAQGGASGYGPSMMFYPAMTTVTTSNPNRPPSTGPQAQPPRRERKQLSIVDPGTGKDVTDEILHPGSGHENQQQNQIIAEFAAKVAESLQHSGPQPTYQHQGESHAADSGSPTMVSPEIAAAQLAEEEQQQQQQQQQQFTSMNGEAEPSIRPSDVGAPQLQPHATQATATIDSAYTAQQPVPPEPSAPQPTPLVPPEPTQAVTAPTAVAQDSTDSLPPAKEPSPASVPKEPKKEATPVKEASPAEPKHEAPKPVAAPAESAVAASAPAPAASTPSQATKAPQGATASEPDSRQGPRDGGRKNSKRNKRDLNKRGESKEGTDMDAFYDASNVKSPVKTSPPEEQPEVAAAPAPTPPAPATPSSPAPPKEEPKQEEPKPAAPAQAEPVAEPEPKPAAQPEKEPPPAQEGPSPAPQVTVTPEPQENGVEGELEEEGAAAAAAAADDTAGGARPKNGITLKYSYKEDQWSPLNPEGKRQYDREFLLQLQSDPESNQRPSNLPDLPDIILDRPANVKPQMANLNKAFPDFTPGFFVKANQSRSGGPGSMSKRGSQQGRRGGGGPIGGEQRVIRGISINQDIQLRRSENAYRVGVQVAEGASKEEVENKKLYRAFQSILNKLTPQKFSKLCGQAMALEINTEERLLKVTDQVFEKALSEPSFSIAYSNLCKQMLNLKVPSKADPKQFVQFRALLLTKCQREFESDNTRELDLVKRRKEANAMPDGDEKKAKLEQIEEDMRQARRRSTGNIRFIGELFKLKMLTENIMHDCIFKLLKARDSESLECLCRLLVTIGKDIDTPKAKPRMDQYFSQLHKLAEDRTMVPESRIRFMIRDVIELREDLNWVPRKIQNANKPTTIDQIHKEAAEEKAQQQLLLAAPMPKQDMPGGRGKGGKGGRGSMGGAGPDADPGWNTVQTRNMRQLDASKMKLSRQNVDDSIQLGPGGGSKFSNWTMGSKGGGSRSQEQEKPPGNRYSLLNSMGDGDGRRGFGRSPARGDSGSRGAGRMGDRDRDRDRRDRDRELGGFGRGRMGPRSSQEQERSERERALASARSLLGPGGQDRTSNPPSRDASRDNSRTRETRPEPAAAAPVSAGPDASQMSSEVIENRIKNIVEEFLHNLDFKEAVDCVAEWQNLNHKELVTTMINTVLERSSQARLHVGELLFTLVSKKIVSYKALVDGLLDVMEFAEDMEIDVPKIYEYLGELFGPMIMDNSVLPLTFLKAAVAPLIQSGNGKAGPVLYHTLHVACQRKPHSHVRAQFRGAQLSVSDFVAKDKVNEFIKQRELDWLVQDSEGPSPAPTAATSRPAGWVQDQLMRLLQARGTDNERIFDFIEANVSEEDQKSHQFVRELITAVCRSAISGDSAGTYKVNAQVISERHSLLLKYLENNPKLELQALYALQHLMCDMEHPPGILKALFDVLYDEEIISEESFYTWRDGDHPTEQKGRGVALLSVNAFYAWLKEGEES